MKKAIFTLKKIMLIFAKIISIIIGVIGMILFLLFVIYACYLIGTHTHQGEFIITDSIRSFAMEFMIISSFLVLIGGLGFVGSYEKLQKLNMA